MLCTQHCVCQLCFLVTPQGTNFLWLPAADPEQGLGLGREGCSQWCSLQCRVLLEGSFLQSCSPSDQHRALSGCCWVFRGSLCGFCSLYCCSCQIPADQHRSTKNENWTRAAARTTHRAEGNKVRDGQEEQQLLPLPPGDQRLLLLPAQRPEGLRGAGSKG